MPNPVFPDSTWRSGFLCCITFCLLGTCLAGARVIQSPKHLIKAKGERSSLKCFPASGHNNVFWYQQVTGQGPQFLIQYYEKTVGAKGNIPGRFSAQQFDDYHSEMNMSTLELGDSAVYLCASSLAQPCRVTDSLYPNRPVPADRIEGRRSFLGAEMGTQLFFVACSLLWAGCTEAAITQSPRHKVTETGRKVTLGCHQSYNHNSMYWYRQEPGHGLRLIHYSYTVGTTDKGEVPDGYSVSRSRTEDFPLTLESATRSQTSVYFCASSYSTVLPRHLLSAHKVRLGSLSSPGSLCLHKNHRALDTLAVLQRGQL